MPHNTLTWPVPPTDGVDSLTSAEAVSLDQKTYHAPDFDNGGTWSPSAVIEIGGAGLQIDKLYEYARTVTFSGAASNYAWDSSGPDVVIAANVANTGSSITLPQAVQGRICIVVDAAGTFTVSRNFTLKRFNASDNIDNVNQDMPMLGAGAAVMLVCTATDTGSGGAWAIVSMKSGRVVQTFTATASNAWLCPPGVYFVDLEMWGGGGSGAGGVTGDTTTTNRKGGGPGGGGAPRLRIRVAVTPGTQYDVNIGAGGASVAAGAAGNDGGATYFKPHGGLNLAFAPGGGGAPAGVPLTGGASYAPGGTVAPGTEIVIGSAANTGYAVLSPGQGGFGATGDSADAANTQSTYGATSLEGSSVSGGGYNGGSPGTPGTHDGTGPYYGGGAGAGGGGGPGGVGGSGGNGGGGNHSGAGGAGTNGGAPSANTGAGGGGGGAGGSGSGSGGVGGNSGAGGSGQIILSYG